MSETFYSKLWGMEGQKYKVRVMLVSIITVQFGSGIFMQAERGATVSKQITEEPKTEVGSIRTGKE